MTSVLMPSTPRTHLFPWRALLLVLGIGIFYMATFREGHVWGDDQAAYLSHARSIVEGRPYGDTGFLRSPSSIAPLMYPPVFPLLLAPAYHLFWPNLTPMKIECTVFFCFALFMVYLLLREHGDFLALFTVATVGLCPYFWDFKDTLYSDFPFLAFAFASLWLAGKAPVIPQSVRREILLGILVGLLIGLAYGARTVGFILAPVIILFNCWKTRRITAFGVAAGAISLVVALGQSPAFHIESDYLTPYKQILSVHSLAASPVYYLNCFSVVWENGYSAAFQWVLYGLAAVLALKGFWTRIRANISVLEIFCIAYFLFICLFPWGGRRYLMPVMPFYLFYILIGLRSFTITRPFALRAGLCGGVALLISLCFIGRYSQHDWQEIAGGEQSKDAVQLVDYLKSADVKSGSVIFRKARWLAFHCNLRAGDPYCGEQSQDDVSRYYQQIGATRFVVSRIFHDQPENDLTRWVEQSGDQLIRQFENDSFSVYGMR